MADAKVSDGTQLTDMPLTGKMYVDDSGVDKYVNFDDLTETGTFTPTIYGATTAGTQTYSGQSGFYCRVGKMVQFSIYINMTAKDGTTSGSLRIGGLPYTSHAAGGSYTPVSLSFVKSLTLTSSYFPLGHIQPATDYINLYESNGSSLTFLDDTNLQASTDIMVAGCYRAV